MGHAVDWCTTAGRETSYERILDDYPVSLVVLIYILVVYNVHQLFTMMQTSCAKFNCSDHVQSSYGHFPAPWRVNVPLANMPQVFKRNLE